MSDPYSDQNASFAERAGSPIDGRPTMLISGGSSGLGRELVRYFSPSFNVVFGFKESVDQAETLFAEIDEAGNWAMPFRLKYRG